MAASQEELVSELYKGVMKDVLTLFGDEPDCSDEVVEALQQLWERKLAAVSSARQPSPSSSFAGTTAAAGGPARGSAKLATASPATRMVQIWIILPRPGSTLTILQPEEPLSADAIRVLPLELTVGSDDQKMIPVQVPADCLHVRECAERLARALQEPSVKTSVALPAEIAQIVLQQHVNTAFKLSGTTRNVEQVDGVNDESDEEEDDDEEEEDEEKEVDRDFDDGTPLNSDDASTEDEDVVAMLETENVVMCMYDEKNPPTKKGKNWVFKWKNGIMNMNGRDFIFHSADGSAKL